jgi:hypothetical protein
MDAYADIVTSISRFSPDAAETCNFQNLLVVQPQEVRNPKILFRDKAIDEADRSNAYALMMHCDLLDDGFLANANFDSRIISTVDIQMLLQQLEDIISQFSANLHSPLDNIRLLGDRDETSPVVFETRVEQVDYCVHEVISQTSRDCLSAPAISRFNVPSCLEHYQRALRHVFIATKSPALK